MKLTGTLLSPMYWLVVLLAVFLLAACAEGGEHSEQAGQPTQPAGQQAAPGNDGRPQIPGADPQRGAELLAEYGCDACHTIPGIPGADHDVGPPLTNWADRQYIAGNLTNTPENLVYWLRFPQAVEPGTVMPNMGVSEGDAADMAAYLYTLKKRPAFTEILSPVRSWLRSLAGLDGQTAEENLPGSGASPSPGQESAPTGQPEEESGD